MHIRTISCLLILSLLSSCKNKDVVYNLPFPKQRLVPIMIDLHVAEASLQQFEEKHKDSIRTIFFTQICTIHKVTKPELEQALADLRKDAFVFEQVQTEVVDSIRVMEERVRQW